MLGVFRPSCLALAFKKSPDPVCPEKLWQSQPCKCTGPVKDTVVEALNGKDIASAHRRVSSIVTFCCTCTEHHALIHPPAPNSWPSSTGPKHKLVQRPAAVGVLPWFSNVTIGVCMRLPASPKVSSSMLTVPSGPCCSERRTAKQNWLGLTGQMVSSGDSRGTRFNRCWIIFDT